MAHGNPRVGCHYQSRWCQPWVSSPTMLLRNALAGWWVFTDAGAPREAASLPLCLAGARGNQPGAHSLPRDSTAQLRSAQCIGTLSHSSALSLTHTHPPLDISLTLTAATAVDADTAVELLLNYFLPSSLWLSEGIRSSARCPSLLRSFTLSRR